MKKNNKNTSIFGITIGVIGFLAGLFLIFSGQTFIGIAGCLACAGVAIKGFKDVQKD
jgi:hypothetical protein